METAKQIRQNAQEYQQYVKDLVDWEKNITEDSISNVKETAPASLVEKSLIEKEKGNQYYSKSLYKKALNCYTKSLSYHEGNGLVYGNRAMTWIKLECFKEAEQDCISALDIDPKNIKALWRRGIARKELGKLKESKMDLQYALVLEPTNKAVKNELDSVLKLLGEKNSEANAEIVKNTPVIQRPIRKQIIIEEFGECKDDLNLSEAIDSTLTTGKSTNLELASKLVETKSIKSESKNHGTIEDAIKSLSLSLPTRSMTQPTNMVEFQRDFKSFKDDPESLFKYIKMISPSSYPQLFKNSFEEIYLVKIIHILYDKFLSIQEIDLAYEILSSLSKIQRFKMTLMFLSKKDRIILKELVHRLGESKDITQLEKAYKCS